MVWALRDPDGRIVESGEQALTVSALSSRWLDKLDFTGRIDLTCHYLSYAFLAEGNVISEGTALFCAPKHFAFADPQLTAHREGDTIIVTASAYAKHVCVESEDADLLLSDNFFDMNAGEKRVTILRGSAEQLRLRSVYSLG